MSQSHCHIDQWLDRNAHNVDVTGSIPVPATNFMTEPEIAEEWRYRRDERLSILQPEGPFTAEQMRIAIAESNEWLKRWRAKVLADV